jgi:multicomponent Na+:H+ antiporter subunit D
MVDMNARANLLVATMMLPLLAFTFAFAGLYPRRFPAAVRRGAGMFGVPLRVVRRAHSGHIGDYVAWLLVGLALLGALVGVPVR